MARLEGNWSIINVAGEVLELHGIVTRLTGYGMAQASYAGQRTPTQHGSSHLGFRLEDREVMIGLLWRGKWQSCLEGKRADLRKIFSYLAGPLTIRRELGQAVRELRQCWYLGGLEGDSDITWDDAEAGAVSLLCRDPAWYDPDAHVSRSSDWNFQATNGYSAADVDLTTNGDWYAYPTLILAGPLTSIQIENKTTGQVLRLCGGLMAGEEVTIICNPIPGPSATDGLGKDVQDRIPPGDDFGGFCLWPHPLADGGVNEWTVTVSGMGVGSAIEVWWEDRYQGA